MVKCENRLREVGKELPFLLRVDGGGEGVMEVQPFVGGVRFAKEGVVLERLFGISSEAV